MVAGRKSRVRYGAVWKKGAPHGLWECDTAPGCDGRGGSGGGRGGTDVKRPLRDAKRDGPWQAPCLPATARARHRA